VATENELCRATALVWRVGLGARGFMLRTQSGPLRRVWAFWYECLLRSIAAWLRRGVDAAVYVSGTFGHDDPVFGVSDVDLVVVAPDDRSEPGRNRRRMQQCWQKLCARIPPVSWVISGITWYEENELLRAVSSTYLTYGLGSDRAAAPAAFFGPGRPAEPFLLLRPGLWPTREWRLVAGADRRPTIDPEGSPERQWPAAWLDLQFWWRYAFDACLDPEAPQVPFLCVKLVAEPARTLLWVQHGERVFSRKAVLERAIDAFPEEAPAFRSALELLGRLHRSPSVVLDEYLPSLVRLSSRLGRTIEASVASAETTNVTLVGGAEDIVPPEPLVQPLVDWRALARPFPGDEALTLLEGDAGSAAELSAALCAYRPVIYPVLRAPSLLIMAAPPRARRELRGVQFAASDPVSFAVVEGRRVASFVDVPGWSARDTARRAVAEHRAWLDFGLGADNGSRHDPAKTLAMLLSAIRVALFHDSLRNGEPELALTLAAAAKAVANRGGRDAQVAGDAYASYRDALLTGRTPRTRVVEALEIMVRRLPAYTGQAVP
jgi:hypothetical protein